MAKGKGRNRRVWPRILAALIMILLAAGFARGYMWILPGYDMGVSGEPLRMCAPVEAAWLLRGRPGSSARDNVTGGTTLSYPRVRVFGRTACADYEFIEGSLMSARYEIPAEGEDEALFAAICGELWRSGRYAGREDGGERVGFLPRQGDATGIRARVERRDHSVSVEIQGSF